MDSVGEADRSSIEAELSLFKSWQFYNKDKKCANNLLTYFELRLWCYNQIRNLKNRKGVILSKSPRSYRQVQVAVVREVRTS